MTHNKPLGGELIPMCTSWGFDHDGPRFVPTAGGKKMSGKKLKKQKLERGLLLGKSLDKIFFKWEDLMEKRKKDSGREGDKNDRAGEKIMPADLIICNISAAKEQIVLADLRQVFDRKREGRPPILERTDQSRP